MLALGRDGGIRALPPSQVHGGGWHEAKGIGYDSSQRSI
jgi:hypothetical protein